MLYTIEPYQKEPAKTKKRANALFLVSAFRPVSEICPEAELIDGTVVLGQKQHLCVSREQAGRLIGDIADFKERCRSVVVPELVRRIQLISFLDIQGLIIVAESGHCFAPVVERQPYRMPFVLVEHREVSGITQPWKYELLSNDVFVDIDITTTDHGEIDKPC